MICLGSPSSTRNVHRPVGFEYTIAFPSGDQSKKPTSPGRKVICLYGYFSCAIRRQFKSEIKTNIRIVNFFINNLWRFENCCDITNHTPSLIPPSTVTHDLWRKLSGFPVGAHVLVKQFHLLCICSLPPISILKVSSSIPLGEKLSLNFMTQD